MNHSIDWLDKQEDSSCVLKFAINRGRESIIKRKAHDEEVIGEKIKRMKLKFQKKDSNLRRNIQRKAKQMMKNKSLTMQCVSQLHDNMDNMTKETCYEFITNINEFTGRELHHMWLDEESGREEKYKGRITKVARGGQSLTMKYDIPGDDDPAYNMKTIEIIADIVLGDLVFKDS